MLTPPTHYDFRQGATLLIDKPTGWTSFDVVNKVRYTIKKQLGIKKIKVGHSGTLDPLATGLLLLCTGKYTRQLNDYQGLDKTYTGTLRLGGSTPSYDSETAVDELFPFEHITADDMEAARHAFLGDIEQVPPMFSAIKVDGQPLYKKARRGESIAIAARPVHISRFDLTQVDLPQVDFLVACSKGTYIRSLAHDFGRALGSGAYLTALRRTRIGEFRIEDAWSLEALLEHIQSDLYAPDTSL